MQFLQGCKLLCYKLFFIFYFSFIGVICASELIPYKKNHITLLSDNDAYFEPTNYDRYYTAGHNLSYTSKEYIYSPLSNIALLSRLFDDEYVSAFGISFGQEIYTPQSRYAVPPPKNDAPYAGYIYLDAMIQNRTYNFLEQLELNTGLVGEDALGKEAQDYIHNLIGLYHFAGWDYQIKNEFILNLYYKAIYRFDVLENIIDFLPYGIIALGNARTHAEFGMRMRIGYGLNGDFGIQKATTNRIGTTSLNDCFRFYILGGISERFVGRNIFIQGNTIGGFKTELDINRLVYEAELGAIVAYKGISLSYIYSYKQKEFSTQPSNSNYATIALEISF